MTEPTLPKTAWRISGSSWCMYWWAIVKPTRYLRSSESMLAKASVVNFELVDVDEEIATLCGKHVGATVGGKADRGDEQASSAPSCPRRSCLSRG